MAKTHDRMWTTDEIAGRLHVSSRKVRRLTAEGKIHVHRIGRAVRISEADYQSYLKSIRT